jgi:hypothetical protein
MYKDEEYQGYEDDEGWKKQTMKRRIWEFFIAALFSVVIHTMSYDTSDGIDDNENPESSHFDYFNYFFRKLL